MCSYVFHSSLKTRTTKNTMLMMISILILILRKKMKITRKEIKVGRSLVGNLMSPLCLRKLTLVQR